MTTERIKEIQQQTAYPDSVSVQQALLQVWNECSQLPKQEISDEDREKASNEAFLKIDERSEFFKMGAKWYREQLKQRQNGK